MGCYKITASRVGFATISATSLGRVDITAERGESASVAAERVGHAMLQAQAEARATITASRLCTVTSGAYLVVDVDVVWLTEDNSFSQDIDVMSNTEWTIE